ncbi:MAG: TIGR03617 family F420-dependent LLM class oxidoreductase [Armatimonadota bacterium]|nr:TIGR03617 family F420-dependent LLM class oxidoreductase [Armatimonadota bacterium]MDR7520129.1 TIGR03617 family F420-dependent LLM class oxidoreductase [Armatimonadota bacterium]
MRVDARLVYRTLAEVPAIAGAAERLGFDGLWASETDHDPFLALALAAGVTTRIQLGTSIALAFTRSPTTLAHTAWDLAQFSQGRFTLGLGTQVKAHITRRFGMPWDPPAPKLREVVAVIRAVWAAWSEGRPLSFRGKYFTLSLMTPFFTPPGPTPPGLRIDVAGVGARLCRLAGEVADGFHVHPFHTRRYLREVVVPQLAMGLQRSGRARRDFTVTASVFVAMGSQDDVRARLEEIRRTLAFYASTPTYRPVLALHGWAEIGEQLSRLAARGQWEAMGHLVSDEMLAEAALWGAPDEVAVRLRAEYTGLVDRIATYEAVVPGQREDVWRVLLDGLRRIP